MDTVQLAALLPYALPFALGWAVSYATALLAKSHLASSWKLILNGALTVVAAAAATAPYATTGDLAADLKAYGVALVLASIANALAYIKGGPQVVERATWNVGLFGKKVDTSDVRSMGELAAADQSTQPE